MQNSLLSMISEALPGVTCLPGEPMARHTSFRIGGPAELMLCPKNEEELRSCLSLCRAQGIPYRILGGGTNVLAPDEGICGAVILTRGLDEIRLVSEIEIEAGCGLSLARLALFAQKAGLTGLEFAHGIPGTVGGGMYMNAGAYGGELAQTAVSARVLRPEGDFVNLEGPAMGLSYRHSAFMEAEGVIVSARFRLTPGDPEAILARMKELAERRRSSQPLDLPSAGSAFKRPKGGYAAALIQQAGLKGYRVGDAAVSSKHSGFIVNLGSATARDVLDLVEQVQEKVYRDTGIDLEPEVQLW